METRATFSPCRTYRYSLTRRWGTRPHVLFIGLNPSTADETQDDPTIRRCIGFAERWGYGGLVMANLFAFRATDPKAMLTAPDPVGPENDDWLRQLGDECERVLAAWGAHGRHMGRGAAVMRLLGNEGRRLIYCLGTTRVGYPKHPLYLRADTQPMAYAG